MGLKSALRELWDICGVMYMPPEMAAQRLEDLRIKRLPPDTEKQRPLSPSLEKDFEAARPSVGLRWRKDGKPVDTVSFGDVEPGQQMGRLTVENSGARPLRPLTIEAPDGVDMAWAYDGAWCRTLRVARGLKVGGTASFVVRASAGTFPGSRTGVLQVSEDAEHEWETYG